MLKKISAQNATCQMLLKKDLSALKSLLNLAGRKEIFKYTNVIHAITNGIILISTACLQKK